MKILALSDRVVESVYSSHIQQNYGDVDLVLGCGDLPMYYLEFVADSLTKPVLFVRGNHDTQPEQTSDGRLKTAPEGCQLLDDRVMVVDGVMFLGLGGSMRYRPGADQQFSEIGMLWRILRRLPELLWKRLRHGRLEMVVVTHSPPRGVGDLSDRVHTGFKAFLSLMKWLRPGYLLHGHVSDWQAGGGRTRRYLYTQVINVNPVHVQEIPSRV
jgi:Icc-related predicted phosphoesterase